jgi:hypothetical protein
VPLAVPLAVDHPPLALPVHLPVSHHQREGESVNPYPLRLLAHILSALFFSSPWFILAHHRLASFALLAGTPTMINGV